MSLPGTDTFIRQLVAAGLVIVASAAAAGAVGQDAAPRFNTDRAGVAAAGYDVVAYFTDYRPVRGNAAISHTWQGATFRFATAEHRDVFAAAPGKYAPQFGGFCAWAVSRNYTADIDPEAWSVVNGRLFLNYSKRVQETWLQNRDTNIVKGDANWPALSRKK
jgi:hypothetical protein